MVKKLTAIRATGTIKRASKRNVYLPCLSPSLSLSLRSLSPSLSRPAFVLYVNVLSDTVTGPELSHLSGAQAQLKKFSRTPRAEFKYFNRIV